MFRKIYQCFVPQSRIQIHNHPRDLPPSIEWLIAHRNRPRVERSRMLGWARGGMKKDRPIDSLYRMYENIVDDWTIELRNEIEYFWNMHKWAVSAIPDPQDPDPARYAILSVIPSLLVQAFNRNISIGLPRDAPATITDMEELERKPKILESEPTWCKAVPQLEHVLSIPSEEGENLLGKSDERASPEFLEKNVLAWAHHILFV